jgi:hypothetical protein
LGELPVFPATTLPQLMAYNLFAISKLVNQVDLYFHRRSLSAHDGLANSHMVTANS